MNTVETTHDTVRVQALPAEDLPRAAALIAASFREEGFTRNTLKLTTPEQRQRFAEAGEVRLLLSQAGGEQVLAATIGETLAGVAIVRPPAPQAAPWYQQVGIVLRHAPRLLPMLKDMYWWRTLQIIPAGILSVTLPRPYYTLDILAVSPECQGQGVGRRLLEHFHALCDQDEQASGIYLITGDEKNTRIYRRFGYEIVETKQGGALTVWHMFRPHPARDVEAFFAALREAAPEQASARRRKFALPILGVAGTIIGLALLRRWLRSRA